MYQPYAYLIGWSKLNKWYYGIEYSRTKKIANPKNLWKIYFTSSLEVATYREYCGEPDVIQIRKLFDNAHKAINWENRVLRKLKVNQKSKWINKNCNGNGTPVLYKEKNGFYNKKHSEKTKEKIKNKRIGFKHSIEFRNNRRITMERLHREKRLPPVNHDLKWRKNQSLKMTGNNNPMFGKNHSEETIKKISNKNKKRMIGNNNPMFGKNHSEETKTILKIKSLNKIWIINKITKETKRIDKIDLIKYNINEWKLGRKV